MKYPQSHYKKGQVVLIAVIFFMAISLVMVLGVSFPIVQQIRGGVESYSSKQSYILADSLNDDVIYRFNNNKTTPTTQTVSLNGASSTVTVTNTGTSQQIQATANLNNLIRKIQSEISLGSGVSFRYGVQTGEGGFSMSNSSYINGNVYSGGPIIGNNSNYIYGDAISAGPSGLIYGVHATGTAYAHTIGNAAASTVIDKDAYYQTKLNTTVSGISYPSSPDQATSSLPISDDLINQWEAIAAAGGTLATSTCNTYSSSTNTCTISSSKTIGPVKVPFNLIVRGNSTILTLGGHVWVTGNITTQNGATIKISPSLGSTNVAFIADNPSDQLASSIITMGQNTLFQGSGSSNSYVFMISQNKSAENGGSTNAISIGQSANALVVYASHGLITLSQSVSVSEVTAYKMTLTQSANVIYDRGLPNVAFSAGPSGGYNVLSWQEVSQ